MQLEIICKEHAIYGKRKKYLTLVISRHMIRKLLVQQVFLNVRLPLDDSLKRNSKAKKIEVIFAILSALPDGPSAYHFISDRMQILCPQQRAQSRMALTYISKVVEIIKNNEQLTCGSGCSLPHKKSTANAISWAHSHQP